MNRFQFASLAHAGSIFALVFAAACSASDPEPAPPTGGRSDGPVGQDESPSTPSPSGSATRSPAAGASAPPQAAADGGAAPAGEGAAATCVKACAADNPDGEEEFSAILVPCACAADACRDACSTCPTATSSNDLLGGTAACRACVQKTLAGGGACNTKLRKECPAKASCPAYAICAQQCQ
jgi:hypothetical protein